MRRVYLMLFALGLMIAGCGLVYAQTPVPVQFEDSIAFGIEGTTRCDKANKPIIHILKSVWGTPEFNLVLKHELEHVRQAEREGDCRRFLKHYQDDTSFRFQCELDAYMTEAPDASFIDTITDQLEFPYYNFPYSRDFIRMMVKARFPP